MNTNIYICVCVCVYKRYVCTYIYTHIYIICFSVLFVLCIISIFIIICLSLLYFVLSLQVLYFIALIILNTSDLFYYFHLVVISKFWLIFARTDTLLMTFCSFTCVVIYFNLKLLCSEDCNFSLLNSSQAYIIRVWL